MNCLQSDIHVMSQEALNLISERMSTDGFDTVRYLLDQYSGKLYGRIAYYQRTKMN